MREARLLHLPRRPPKFAEQAAVPVDGPAVTTGRGLYQRGVEVTEQRMLPGHLE
jgi:hypothetical protein